MKLLIGTTNKAKFDDIKAEILAEKPYMVVVSPHELSITSQPLEDGLTLEENALLKAKYYGDLAQLPTIADDSGLYIDALHGEPGVKSRRWINGITDSTDEELIDYCLQRMQGIPFDNRSARFTACVAYYNPYTGTHTLHTESIEGTIASTASHIWKQGYPFRALFKVKDLDKYYDELTPDEHALVSHRIRAVRNLLNKIGV